MYDLLIIGGGINGAAIARDAAGRGLSVLLVEKGDFAGATSSASTKLVHGGLRYLEHYEFRLVREALLEREVLLRAAPHIIWPLRIVLPHHKGLRPQWLLRLGLFLYDHLGARKLLPGTQKRDLSKAPHAGVLKPEYKHGFEFSDCWVDDARLVIGCCRDAEARGATLWPRSAVTGLRRDASGWQADITTPEGARTISAKAVVNAAGMGVDAILEQVYPDRDANNLRLIKGSHIVVPRLYAGEHLYMFQHDDDRIVFAIPYERDFTLIGTTDTPYDPAEGAPEISPKETQYLLDIVNDYLATPITAQDIVWTYSGVRPLYDDKADSASTVTRDYVFDLDTGGGGDAGDSAPLLSIFGGKITTHRRLAEHALEKLGGTFPAMGPGWTADAAFPGGDIAEADFDGWFDALTRRFGWMPIDVLHGMARRHGTTTGDILANLGRADQLGQDFGGGLFEVEARWLIKKEWARTADDVLWRRTKCGLHMRQDQRAAFASWFDGQQLPPLAG